MGIRSYACITHKAKVPLIIERALNGAPGDWAGSP